ncbi:hypothetical protein HA138_11760 [Mycobacteroides chelonae]|uniref:hypothetical protein n=1 Tax=Mycobacteroides chelonae TaxID=1774 RepID=UPI0018B0CCF5|nr:hypothetical protein [Mycobacteroides chelonae]MBF9350449.1 hypothetical protein [Mycobacteroides chelonae]
MNDNVIDQELPAPAWRRKRMTEEQVREEAFQRYLRNSVNYNQAISDNGDTPWHQEDVDARRELFMRRYRNN